MEEAEALMEEQVDQGMEEAAHSFLERPSPKESFNSDSLLAPDADFMMDDRSSAASGLDVADRLTYLEQRMQMQEDEIQLLKMALADVLKRLSISEEQQAAGRRAAGLRARPVSLALPPRPPMVTSPLKKCPTMPSCSTPRSFSPTPSRRYRPADVLLLCSDEAHFMFLKGRSDVWRVLPAGAWLHFWGVSYKPPQDAPKVNNPSQKYRKNTETDDMTMQIYLSPLARKTGSSEAAASAAAARADRGPAATPVKTPRPNESRKATPSFTLNLQKSSQSSTQDISSYKSPTKSPSQYFQICY
ncbi:Echinoderm microtubule-associated protein-like 1 [Oryzias melastigma]|uniref:Echinoderm microtubule-associated protein-like 1 n=1 Tax=Oryzias melastigma TaxID=30732 RepID=A0A834F6P2_ORYME|nr:Echinoderm microtubule-associated protein-like 1 [Oryzias melastigma]